MSILLGKYRYIRRLGGGTYGDVQLVTDINDKQIAIKMIPKKIIEQEPYLEEYIQGEKECMKSVRSPYIVELYDVQQDKNYKYFVCQFCDGGDLLSYQSKQPQKVFKIGEATKILSQVILGLQLLHRTGYVHRDIKPQNILLKKDKQGQYIFKLADFGFAKRIEQLGGTMLGTENYMSPEIYANQFYSFEVDMWAFGVLFYFMLNMELPFTLNVHAAPPLKRQELINQATNFSYSQKVKESKKKIVENCTQQMQDLFKKMFDPNPKKRINFAQIRIHPIFKKYFPNISQSSSKIYQSNQAKNKWGSFIEQKTSGIKDKKFQINNPQYYPLQITSPLFLKKPKMSEQGQIVECQIEKINFLIESAQELNKKLNFVDKYELLALIFNVLKYYVILLRNFIAQFNAASYQSKYPNYKWNWFFKSEESAKIKQQVEHVLNQTEMKVSENFDSCRISWGTIKKFNPKLELVLQASVSQKQFSGNLKQSYRCSTTGIFSKLRQKININSTYAYYTLLVFLVHAYNNILKTSQQDLQMLFDKFVKEKGISGKLINFRQLKTWMSQLQIQQLKRIFVLLNKTYFPKN